MRTVSYRLADLSNVTISLGFVGENEHTRVQFDAKKIFEQYPDAIPALTVQPPKGDAYPAVITLDGDYVIWDVTDSDLAYQGMGEIQLVFTEGETVAKSYIARTRISRSIVPTGEVPEPVQTWIDQANEVLEEVEEAIPAGGTTGQVLAKKSNADRDTEWVDQTGGGTSNYNDLSNKPQIGGVTLSGNKTLHDLGAAAEEDIPDVHNVPAGGSANQVLAKASGTDYDLKWVNQSGGGGGGAEIDDTAGEGDTDVVWSADKTWTENEALKEAIENVLVYESHAESATLNNLCSTQYLYDHVSKNGWTSGTSALSEGVYSIIGGDGSQKSPYLGRTEAWGTGKWIVGLKYKITKLNQTLGEPNSVRIMLTTDQSEAFDYTPDWGNWCVFSTVFSGNLERIRFSLPSFATAPATNTFKVEIKEVYLYLANGLSDEFCTYIAEQQKTNYQAGQTTYSIGQNGYYPDTTLTESEKAAESKAVGDAIDQIKINVKMHGVKGDGTTDDTNAINDLLSSKTGVFYFPAGTYKISGTLELPANSAIVGDGDTSIINMYVCSDLTQCTFRGGEKIYPYILIAHDNCAVRHIKLTGSSTLYEARHAGVGVLDADRCSVEDVTVFNINYNPEQTSSTNSAYGICVNRSTFVDVVKCDVRQCGYECIGIVDDCDHCTVRDCYTQDGWKTCIQVHRGSCNTLIENNYMKQTGDQYDACFTVHGMEDQKVKNLRVENNTMECTQNGAQSETYCAPAQIMSHVEFLVFTGNRILGGKRAFYITTNSTNAMIIGNDMNCNDTSDYGVTITSYDSIVIGNNLDNEATTKTNHIDNNPVLVGNNGIGS